MLRGTLDDFTLPDVLRLIGSGGRTGRLAVSRDAGRGTLLFRDGAVAGAAGTPQDLTFDLMRWDGGEFSWEPENVPPGPAGDAVSVDDLLAHVARRLEELAEIKTLVPSEEAVLVMAPQPPEGAVEINIAPAEWRVLVMVDCRRPVRDIAAAAGLDGVAAMKVLYGLASAGLVTHAGAPPPREAPSPGPVPDTTDASDTSAVFDAAGEEEVCAADPEPEGLLAAPPEAPEAGPAVAAPPGAPEAGPAVAAHPEAATFAPGLDAPPFEASGFDRSTAARELAGLFDAGHDPGPAAGGTFVASPPTPPRPRRVEDDDQVTRGLISRLIDGVKGL
ncbi:MAG: DUF4388 domain-containing protein [Actinomycetota bacterium]